MGAGAPDGAAILPPVSLAATDRGPLALATGTDPLPGPLALAASTGPLAGPLALATGTGPLALATGTGPLAGPLALATGAAGPEAAMIATADVAPDWRRDGSGGRRRAHEAQ